MALLLCGLGVLSVCVSSQAGLTVEAGPGDDVTLWCEHGLTRPDYIFWCKHTNNSAPVYMACRYYTAFSSFASSNPCYFMTEGNRTEMEVNSVNSSLTITAVQDSDSGLYYCSRLENKYMIYSTTTYLHIREKFPASSNKPYGDDRWSDGFFILALVGGAVIVVLLSVLLVLLFTVLKYRRQHREDSELKHESKEQDGDVVNYAALQFPTQKKRRSERRVEAEDTHVGYSSVRR